MIDRDVIIDLLPLYRAGLASPATRALVEAYLAEHPELERTADASPDEAKWRESLERSRRLARRRRYLFAMAVAFSALAFAIRLDVENGRVLGAHLLAMDAPLLFVPLALAAGVAWLIYWRITRAT